MVDENDYIIKQYYCKKTSKSKPQRWLMHYCDKCGCKRSYAPRSKTGLCTSCANLGKTISTKHKNKISKTLQKNKNYLGHTVESRTLAGVNAAKTRNNWSEPKKKEFRNKIAASKLGMDIDQYLKQKDLIQLRRRLAHNIRSSIYNCIKGSVDQLRHVDWSIEDLTRHLESKFKDGMSWDNYGRKPNTRCWEIDHIIPINARVNGEYLWKNINDPESEDFKKCWSLNNLQPMWAEDNNSKNNRLDYDLDFK